MNHIADNKSSAEHSAVQAKLPLLVKTVLVLTVLACVSNESLTALKIGALAWIIPFLFSAAIVFSRPGKITLPYSIWGPWISLTLIYLVFSDVPNALQRTIMMICPIFVGMAVSTMQIDEFILAGFRKAYLYMAAIFLIGILFKSGILLTGALPMNNPFAAEVMTGSLLCCMFAANYSFGRARDLLWWAALAVIPVIAVTRMGILATGVSLPLTFAPLNFAKRLVFIVIIFIAGIFVFQSERVQQKMFYGGQGGTIQDVRLDNPNFATSGRTFMWDALKYEISKEPWLGHGANGDEVFLIRLFGKTTQPHNDWIRLTYNYGYVGSILFGLTMLLQLWHAWKRGRNSKGDTSTLFFTGASSFLIFSLFMLSDNIILYAAFFGNLQFTILGLAYASYNAGLVGSESPREH
jgi:O-antigen ligase